MRVSQTVAVREGSLGRTVEYVRVELALPRAIWAWRDIWEYNGGDKGKKVMGRRERATG